ncbi:3-hydroxyisobutyryl-CoA hydrolase [Leucobacter sp. GX0328]
MSNATASTSTEAANTAPEPLIIARRSGAITRITLNRPRAINALNREMFLGLETAVGEADGSAILLDGAGERGFCGGGDIKELAASGTGARDILAIEYRVDHMIGVSRTPVVGFMDGVTMGGGIGLTGHAQHRVVTERSRLAMPEVRIGIVPDVGGHLLLARAPGRLGELLAVTSGEMAAGDAIALGFADYFVPAERLGALAAALEAGEEPGAACARFSEPAPASTVAAARTWWDPIAEAALADVEAQPREAALRLLAGLDAAAAAGGEGAADAAATAETVRGMCPVSVAVTLAQISRTRRASLDLRAVLEDDLRVLGRLSVRPDFAEGVRAQVIDKDRNPRWRPTSIEAIDEAELARVLDPVPLVDEPPIGL